MKARTPLETVDALGVSRSVIENFIVPIDFSLPSIMAMEMAVLLAAPVHACVHLVHVVHAETPVAGLAGLRGPARDAEVVDDCRRELERLAHMHEIRGVGFRIESRLGDPARDIARFAVGLPRAAIVISTHGLSSRTHFALGDVTERVIGVAPCPVLVMRKPVQTNPASRDAHRPFSRVVVPVDFSPCCSEALSYAVAFARDYDGKITLLHSYDSHSHLPELLQNTISPEKA